MNLFFVKRGAYGILVCNKNIHASDALSYKGGKFDKVAILETIEDLAQDNWKLVSAIPVTKGSFWKQFGSTPEILLFLNGKKSSRALMARLWN